MKKLLLSLIVLCGVMVSAQQKQTLRGSKTMEVTYLGTSPSIKSVSQESRAISNPNPADAYIVPNKLTKTGMIESIENPNRDPVMQKMTSAFELKASTVKTSFDGGSNVDNAAINGFNVAPPDTQGDVGPNHYVQMVNSVTTIFDKSGNVLLGGPFANSAFFQNLDPRLAGTNDGDPIVVYDQFEDRWIVSQFAVSAGAPYFMLVAVSTTNDPTGTYNQYAIDYGNDFPDYPKLGIWNDALYITTRDFLNGASFAGFSIVAINKFDMYNGVATAAQRFEIDNPDFDGIVPADADGTTPPPVGEPHYSMYLSASGNSLNLVTTSIDFDTPANSTLVFGSVPVAPYSFFQTQIPQPNGQSLDGLPFFLMYRLQYINFGTHASMVVNHSVQEVSGGDFGVRWYEFRDTGAPWAVYQQGTYLPNDGLNRWMGSIAMNADGDIALGYSVASATLNPSIRFVGQSADQSGTGVMNIAENSILEGTLSSRGTNRWGDYAMMSMDPSDNDFWFTTEYIAVDQSFSGWGTNISEINLDVDPPIAVCQDITVDLDADVGSVTITPEQIDNGSTGANGGEITLSLDIDTFDCTNIGENTVTLTVTGTDGSSAICTAIVTVNVIDTEAPVAVCQDITVELAQGATSVQITPEQIDGGSTDNCAIDSIVLDQDSFTELGDFTVTLTVTDKAGLSSTCTATVTVAGGPSITVDPLTLNAQVNLLTDIPPIDQKTFTVTNNGGLPLDFTTEVAEADFTPDPTQAEILANLDRSIYTNNNGATGTLSAADIDVGLNAANIEIMASNRPVLDSIFYDSGANIPGDFVGFNVGGPALTAGMRFDVPAGDSFELTSIRNSYRTETLTGVSILLRIYRGGDDPSLGDLLLEQVVTGDSPDGVFALETLNVPQTFAPGEHFWVVHSYPEGIPFPQGYDDTIVGRPDSYVFSSNGGASYTFTTGFPYLTRALSEGNTLIALSPETGTVAPGESAEVTVTFDGTNFPPGTYDTDIFVNSNDTNNPQVTVETTFLIIDETPTDTEDPVITCPEPIIVDNDAGICGAEVTLVDPTATDNISLPENITFQGTRSDGLELIDPFPVGETTISWTATDEAGNVSDSCDQLITVNDDELPEAICQDITIQLDGSGNATIDATNIDGGSTDNCAIASLALDVSSFTDANLGSNTVTLTVKDESGNEANCSATVTVEAFSDDCADDTTPPTVSCNDITVALDENGEVSITVEDLIGEGFLYAVYPWQFVTTGYISRYNYDSNTDAITLVDGIGETTGVKLALEQNPIDGNVYLLADLEGSGGSGGNVDRSLFLFDIETGTIISKVASIVSTTGATNPNAMTFGNDGTLYIGFGLGEINTFDFTTNTTSAFTTAPAGGAQGLTYDNDSDRIIYHSLSTDTGAPTIYEISLSGVVNELTTVTVSCSGPQAIEYIGDGKALGSSTFGCNILYTVDLTTGATTEILTPVPFGNIKSLMLISGASDNCGIDTIVADLTTFDCTNIGDNTVTVTVTDLNGNQTSCTSIVTVEDNTAPIAVCQDITIQLDASGNATIEAADVDGGSTDNCAIESLAIDISSFTEANLGDNTVTLTVTDESGNPATCTATVTVEESDEDCPDFLPNEDPGIVIPSGELDVDLDVAVGTSTDTNGSPCALIVSTTENDKPWARYRIPLILSSLGINAGDELFISLDGKGDGARMEFIINNTPNQALTSNSYGADWSTHSANVIVPDNANTLDIWLFGNYNTNVPGTSVYDNLILVNLSDTGGNLPPTAVATATPLTGTAPLNVSFVGGNSFDDVAVTGYEWNFGDGSPVSTVANPSHTYTATGTFTATLTVSDAEGLTSSTTVTIIVGDDGGPADCPDSLPNEDPSILLPAGSLVAGLDSAVGTDADTNGSPCALIVTDDGGDPWARYSIPIVLANYGISAGDELFFSVDGKTLEGGNARMEIVRDNTPNTTLVDYAFGGGPWSTFSTTIIVPAGVTTLDIWLYSDYNTGGGASVYDNLILRNLNGCAELNTYYADNDGDGFGDASNSVTACVAPGGFVEDNTDCNDNEATAYPGAPEICDGIDNNCDGNVDEGLDCVVDCPDSIANEDPAIPLPAGTFVAGLDSSVGTNTDTNGSPCALEVSNVDANDEWARYNIVIDLAANGIAAGDQLSVSVDGKSANGGARVEVNQDDTPNTALASNSFGTDWSTFSTTVTVPGGISTINIWLFSNYNDASGGGTGVYDNLTVINLSDPVAGQVPLNAMLLSPNPAVESVTISFERETEVTEYQVFDLLGRLVRTIKANKNGNQQMEVIDLPAGTYFVKTRDNKGQQFQKQMVIKK